MTSLQLTAYSLSLLSLGWLLRGAIQGWWRRNPKPHHAADARHCWVEIGGSWHAFTDDAVATGRARADALNPWFRVNWFIRSLLVLALFALIALWAGCGRDIPTSRPMPVLTAWVGARGESMLPTFPERALVEFELVPFDQLKAGDTVLFWDYTGRTGATFIHHRLIQQQAGSWISKGDNPATNPRADLPWVTRDNYIGRTTGRHTQILTP